MNRFRRVWVLSLAQQTGWGTRRGRWICLCGCLTLLLGTVWNLPTLAGEEANPATLLAAGDHTRTLRVDGQERLYHVHVPESYVPGQPTPLVLALHGAAMNGPMMAWFSGLNQKAEQASFIVVYPSGQGLGPFRAWNSGGFRGQLPEGIMDDVTFIDQLLDELSLLLSVDEKRIYACGVSNGGMMCYRLAAELSERIAAIAPVAGCMTQDQCQPTRPVPVIHFHGTHDTVVPFEITPARRSRLMKFKGAEESVQRWAKLNGCAVEPKREILFEAENDLTVTRQTYDGGTNGAEAVLVIIKEGGHTWPGQTPPVEFIGKSVKNISANDLLWEFFEKHPLK